PGLPGVVIVDRLEVVRAQHEDHERQRRVDLDALLQTIEAAAPWLVGIVPHRAAAVQAVLDDAYPMAGRRQLTLHDARPPALEREAPAGGRDDSPGERIPVHEDLLPPGRRAMPDSGRTRGCAPSRPVTRNQSGPPSRSASRPSVKHGQHSRSNVMNSASTSTIVGSIATRAA